MNSYKLVYASERDITVDKFWNNVDYALISNYPWDDNGYKPEVRVRAIYTNKGISVCFESFETKIKAEYTQQNDPVYNDSCVEFYVNPSPETDNRYMSFEINSIGTISVGIGTTNSDREKVYVEDPVGFYGIKASETKESVQNYHKDCWAVSFTVPYELLDKYYTGLDFKTGKVFKGNFNKIGSMPAKHYGCWNKIENDIPKFHLPQYFGDMICD